MAKYECQMLVRCQVMVTVEAESEHVAKMKAAWEVRRGAIKESIPALIMPFDIVRIDAPRKRKKP